MGFTPIRTPQLPISSRRHSKRHGRVWDQEFESPLLQRRVHCEPDFLDQGAEINDFDETLPACFGAIAISFCVETAAALGTATLSSWSPVALAVFAGVAGVGLLLLVVGWRGARGPRNAVMALTSVATPGLLAAGSALLNDKIPTSSPGANEKNAKARSSLTGETLGVFRGISCHGIIGGTRCAQPLDQRGHTARRNRAGHLVVRYAGAHPAQHAAEAQGDLAALFGDWNDVALWFAFEAKARPGIMQQHLLLPIQPQQDDRRLDGHVAERAIDHTRRLFANDRDLCHRFRRDP